MFKRAFRNDLFKKSSIYLVSNVVNKLTPFLLLPILTKFLNPADYGYIATFTALTGIVFVLVHISTAGVINVNFFKDKDNISLYVFNSLIVNVAFFLILFFVLYVFRSSFSEFTDLPDVWIPVLAFAAVSQVFFQIYLVILRCEKEAFSFGIFENTKTLMNISLSLFLVVIVSFSWQGRILGIVITNIFFALVGILLIIRKGYITVKIDKKYLKRVLLFGLPLIPHSIAAQTMTFTDRIFLNNMVNISETGLYSVGYHFGQIVGILGTAFTFAWGPYLFELLSLNPDARIKQKIVKTIYLFFFIVIMIVIFVSCTSPVIIKYFLDDKFLESTKYIVWISIAYASFAMASVLIQFIYYVKKNYHLSYITVSVAIINVIANFYLIKINGGVGAAQATALAYTFQLIFIWFAVFKSVKLPWLLKN